MTETTNQIQPEHAENRSSQVSRLLPGPIALGLVVALLVLSLANRIEDPTWVQILRVKTFDLYQLIKPREPMTTQIGVAIVDIDERSLSAIGQWPWSRTTIGDLILQIGKAGGLVVGFDAIFPEYDRTSPSIVADSLRNVDPKIVEALRMLPRNEDAMVNAMKQVPVVVGQGGQSDDLPADRLPPSNKTSVKGAVGGDVASDIFRYRSMLGNVPEIESNASGHGFFTVIDNNIDGIVRRVPLVAMVGKEKLPRPALTIEMLRVAFGGNGIFTKRNEAGMVSVMLQLPGGQRFEIPTDGQGRIFVHFAKPDIFNTPDNSGRLYVSAGDVLKGSISPGKLRGKLVLVGTSATGLKDIRSTPIAPHLPGVEVHANILETIIAANVLEARAKQMAIAQIKTDAEAEGKKLSEQELGKLARPILSEIKQSQFYLRYPNFAKGAEIVIMLVAGLAMIIFVPGVGPLWTLGGLVTATGGLSWLAWYLYAEKLVLVDVTYPGVVAFAIYAVLTFSNYTREAAEKRKVRGAFGMYLSPDMVKLLAEHPDQLKLGGETRQMTFLFCDVRGFTSISETYKANPMGLTQLVNRVLTPLTEAILTRKGTIDKYMGDCIMAFWNAPIDDKKHGEHACQSALAMFDELDTLNVARKREAEENDEEFIPINVGIGINTGDCVVGNMGSKQRFDYSVLGDPVNLAARLEGQSKNYGVKIVIGEDTVKELADNFATLPLDKIMVKGKVEASSIFTMLGGAEIVTSPVFQKLKSTHATMIDSYLAQDWNKAEYLCKECRKLDSGEMTGFYDLYEERIAEYRKQPPGEDWDGVYIATTK